MLVFSRTSKSSARVKVFKKTKNIIVVPVQRTETFASSRLQPELGCDSWFYSGDG
ncbi:hypothetical protein Bpfe_001937, partial [Biomphalaria pfeifferi]